AFALIDAARGLGKFRLPVMHTRLKRALRAPVDLLYVHDLGIPPTCNNVRRSSEEPPCSLAAVSCSPPPSQGASLRSQASLPPMKFPAIASHCQPPLRSLHP